MRRRRLFLLSRDLRLAREDLILGVPSLVCSWRARLSFGKTDSASVSSWDSGSFEEKKFQCKPFRVKAESGVLLEWIWHSLIVTYTCMQVIYTKVSLNLFMSNNTFGYESWTIFSGFFFKYLQIFQYVHLFPLLICFPEVWRWTSGVCRGRRHSELLTPCQGHCVPAVWNGRCLQTTTVTAFSTTYRQHLGKQVIKPMMHICYYKRR